MSSAPDEQALQAAAERALVKLEAEYGTHPDVTFIDLGYQRDQGRLTREIGLRIHVRDRWLTASPEKRIAFPSEIDGIPVIVTRGEYRLE